MDYELRDGLSFCQVDGHPVFLDIRNDRYFMLPTSLERVFSTYASGITTDVGTLAPLIARELLVTARPHPARPPPAMNSPVRSVLEQQATARRASVHDYLEALAAVVGIRFLLMMKPLDSVLRDVCVRRDARVPSACASQAAATTEDTVTATHCFLQARKWIPVARMCLLDSLALVTYLTNRGLAANIVFGVSLSPFSAHCWVQSRDIVLNETVTGAISHTRILTC